MLSDEERASVERVKWTITIEEALHSWGIWPMSGDHRPADVEIRRHDHA